VVLTAVAGVKLIPFDSALKFRGNDVLMLCFTLVSPQAGDVSLLETIVQEFTACERLLVAKLGAQDPPRFGDCNRGERSGKDVWMKHCVCAALLVSLAFGQTMVTRAQVLIDQTPAEANISRVELDLIATILENSADDWQRERAPGLRFKRVALSGAKLDAVFVRSTSAEDCGATGNCPVWLLRQRAGGFELLLTDFADDVNLADQRSKGWRNIVLATNRSAESSELRVFAFDEHTYVTVTCYEESSSAGRVFSHKISCK
jgi:hypothetical protein